ncbi:MAG: Hsp20/alpha crystallin family protein [Bacteroidia bacterium]|jgi:HSP20 family protein|nr:Hsp20/alpha crystallin family protein [Bacteroidia bacterium]
MALSLTKTGRLLPTLSTDLFSDDFFTFPSLINWDGGLTGNGLTKGVPSVNIVETSNNFQIEMAAPGMEKKDFKVEVDNGVLTISSEKENEKEEKGKNYTRKEFSYNAFSRSFSLPENCLPEKISAAYDNGLLTLTLPKQEVSISKPKKEIKVS